MARGWVEWGDLNGGKARLSAVSILLIASLGACGETPTRGPLSVVASASASTSSTTTTIAREPTTTTTTIPPLRECGDPPETTECGRVTARCVDGSYVCGANEEACVGRRGIACVVCPGPLCR